MLLANVVVAVQSLSHVWLFVTPWTGACQAPLSSTIFQSLLKFTSLDLVMLSNHLILCCPLLLLCSNFPRTRVFPSEWLFSPSGQITRVSASSSVLSMNIQDWFPLGLTGFISLQSKGFSGVFCNTTVQKAPILQCSAFFMVQISHPYITTGKTIALTNWTFFGNWSLCFLIYCLCLS